MFIYRNSVTGATIETTSEICGGLWVRENVPAPPKNEEIKKAPKTSTRTKKEK